MERKLTKPLQNLFMAPDLRGLSHFLILIGMLITGLSSVQAATQLEDGWEQDFTFSGVISEPTGGKGSESKLWFNDGFWWGILWSNSGNAYHIHRLEESSQDWLDTGTVVDDRDDSRSDTLWDETNQKLYVASHRFSENAGQSAPAGDRGELYRYSYNTGSDTYTLDSGFPVEVNAARSETLVLEKDSTDRLWVTYTRDQTVYVNHSGTSDTDWAPTTRPFILPTGDTTVDITSDDISSITTFNNNIGVMWSNQSDKKMYFAVHADSASPTSGWSSGIVAFGAGTNPADDHINLASLDGDPAGEVFAITKTSETNARNMLLICTSGCTSVNDWSAYTAYQEGTGVGNPTRASVVIDTNNRELYVFTTADTGLPSGRDIYFKVTDLGNIQFTATNIGTPLIKDSSRSLNNVTSTKQNLNGTTGLAALAASSNRYVHNRFALASALQDITVIPSSHSYGDVLVGSSNVFSFEVRNDGSVDLNVSATTLIGANPGEFNIDSGGGVFALTPGSSQNIVVSFNPGSLGSRSATLRINSDDPDEDPFDVALTGNGVNTLLEVTFKAVVTGNSSGTASVATAGSVTAVNGDLYLAAISSKSFKPVTSVTGLGLTWTQVDTQCSGRNQTGVNLWKAQGSPSGSGPVTATLSGTPSNAAIAVSRYSGANQTNPIGNIVSGNSNGVDGGCSGGTDGNAYNVNLSTTVSDSVVVGAIAMRNRSHSPGAGYTERVEFITPGSGGTAASVASMDRTVASASSVTVDGTFSKNVDYALIGVEIKPSAGGGGPVAPGLSKTFGPNPITVGGTSTMTLMIDNSANGVALNALALLDTYPVAISNATTPNVTNTCGGTVTALAGTGSVDLSGGTVAAGGSCTVTVDVTSLTGGGHLNTTGVVSSTEAPDSAVAMDTLTINSAPVAPILGKSFDPNPITAGGTSTLTLTIDNNANGVALTALALLDTYPVAISNATIPNVTNTCGGTVTALADTGSVDLSGGTVAAGGSCTVTVDVTSLTGGGHLNTTGVVSSTEAPDGAVAMDTLTINSAPVAPILFTFAQISDAQPRDAFEQARFEQVLDTLVAAGQPGALIPLPVEFVMFAGDLVNNASSQSDWTSFLDTIDSRLTVNAIPYRAVPGNHDQNSSVGISNYEQFIADSGVWDTDVDVVIGHNGPMVTTGWSGLRIIGFNNSNGGDNEISSVDLTAIEQLVVEASARNENIFLMGHHPHNDGGMILLATSLENPDAIGYMRGHDGSPHANQGLSNVSNPNIWDLSSHGIINRGGILYYEVYETHIAVYPIQLVLNSTTLPTPRTIQLVHALSPDGPPVMDVTLTPTSHDYGAVSVGGTTPFSFEIRNEGTADLSVSPASLIGTDPGEFNIDSGGGAVTLSQGQTHNIVVSFNPITLGAKSATLRIPSDDPDENPVDVALTGSGVDNPPGGNVTFEEFQTGGSSSSSTVATSGSVTAVSGDLYLAAISSKSFKTVTSVTGLGLTWTPVDTQCGGRNQTGVNLWKAQGSPSGSGPVTATLSGTPSNAAIAVSRYSGVDDSNPIGNIVSGNSNGVDGACSGGTDGNAYSINLGTTASGSVVVGTIAMRNRSHSPGAGYTERVEFITPGGGGSAASVASMDRTIVSPLSVTVDGMFSGNVDYAVIGIEIKPTSNPAQDITLAPTSHGYGDVALGGSASSNFEVSNDGSIDLNVTATGLIGTGAGEFNIDNGGGAFTLTPGQMQIIEVSYNPTTLGLKNVTLRINSDDPDEEPFDVPLSGTGVVSAPDITLTPTSHDYGDVFIGGGSASFNFEVSNDGSVDLIVTATSLIGTGAGEFNIDNGGGAFTLTPGQMRIIEVSYSPTTLSLKNATLRINSNDPDEEPFDVALTGTGVITLPDIIFEEVVTGGLSGTASVATAGNVTAVSGDLYLAAISSKSFKTVTSVTGLGLTWTQVDTQCGGRNQTGVNLWKAQGSPNGSGPVTASLSGTPSNAAIAVSRYSGANQTNPIGNIVSANSNGVDGACSGGIDGNAYNVNLSTTVSGSVVVGAIAMRNRSHSPGAGYTERVEFITLGGGGSAASVASMDRTVASPSSVTVDGTFSNNVDYAVIGVEIKP